MILLFVKRFIYFTSSFYLDWIRWNSKPLCRDLRMNGFHQNQPGCGPHPLAWTQHLVSTWRVAKCSRSQGPVEVWWHRFLCSREVWNPRVAPTGLRMKTEFFNVLARPSDPPHRRSSPCPQCLSHVKGFHVHYKHYFLCSRNHRFPHFLNSGSPWCLSNFFTPPAGQIEYLTIPFMKF